jgi:hypothetical protein
MKATITLKAQNKTTKIKDLPVGSFFDLGDDIFLVAAYAKTAPGRCYISLMKGLIVQLNEELQIENDKILSDVSIAFE